MANPKICRHKVTEQENILLKIERMGQRLSPLPSLVFLPDTPSWAPWVFAPGYWQDHWVLALTNSERERSEGYCSSGATCSISSTSHLIPVRNGLEAHLTGEEMEAPRSAALCRKQLVKLALEPASANMLFPPFHITHRHTKSTFCGS